MIRSNLLLIVFLAIVIGMAWLGTGRTAVQENRDPLKQLLIQPVLLSGPDVGFRIMRWDGQIPVGQVVVRVNGVWTPAKLQ